MWWRSERKREFTGIKLLSRINDVCRGGYAEDRRIRKGQRMRGGNAKKENSKLVGDTPDAVSQVRNFKVYQQSQSIVADL